MLIVLSPAKSLDFDTPPVTAAFTQPDFLEQSHKLVALLKRQSAKKLSALMDISDELAQLNALRFASWAPPFSPENAKQAVLAFDGDVYGGLQAPQMTAKQLEWLQDHVRILSGLYGLLRPLDLMQAYRLEMGTRLKNTKGADLYAFWGETQTKALNGLLAQQKQPVLVNLASDEYFRAVKPKKLEGTVITPVFEDCKNGKYKIISFFAKRARGLMARYAATKRISNAEKLKDFDLDGYAFVPEVSDTTTWRFRRNIEA